MVKVILDATTEAAAASAATYDCSLSIDDQSEEVPAEFLDALTCDVMEDPVCLPRCERVSTLNPSNISAHFFIYNTFLQWKHRVPSHLKEAYYQVCGAFMHHNVKDDKHELSTGKFLPTGVLFLQIEN